MLDLFPGSAGAGDIRVSPGLLILGGAAISTGSNSLKEYLVGQLPQITFTFTNASNVLTNPTTVTVQITDPAGTQTNTSNPNAAITNPSTGIWIYTFPAALALIGQWIWRVKCSGTLTDSDEGTFKVLQTLTQTP